MKKYTIELLVEYAKSRENWTEMLRQCGYTNMGNNKYIKKKLDEYNIDYSHFKEYIGKKCKRYTIEDLYCENSTYANGANLRDRIIKDFNFKIECNRCKLTEWQGLPITIEVDHINGIHSDNRIENLIFLCPNCHALTDTWRGRNKAKVDKIDNKCISCQKIIAADSLRCDPCQKITERKVANRPTLEELQLLIKDSSYVAAGKKYGVSDNTIRKWIRAYIKEQNTANAETLPEISIET